MRRLRKVVSPIVSSFAARRRRLLSVEEEIEASRPWPEDRRAYAASSSTIIDGPSSVWKAAYQTARMAVEIANASSDMFLPLKAVVGALSVLIKNYDVGSPPAHHLIGC